MTHPLERLKRIADETIRKQAIENFNQEYYDENSKNDNGNLESAIMWSFDWLNSPQKYDYWNQIWNLSINNQLELLPEEPSELEKVKLENEKLRECQIPEELKDFVNEAMYVINLKKDKRYTNAELSKQKLFEMFEDILYKI